MPRPTSRTPQKSYSEEEIRLGLPELVLCAGSTTRAAKQLKAQGHPIPQRTLYDWATKTHVERYHEVQQEVVPQIHGRIAAEVEAQAIREGELARKLADKLEQEIPNLPARDVAGALRNVDMSRAVNIDKSGLLRGQPTQIVEHRSAADLLRKLEKAGIIEGTAVEVEDEEPPELPPAA